MAKKTDKTQENIQVVEEALSKTEMFLEKHQQTILYGLAAVVILIGVYFGYERFIRQPKAREAQEQMFIAEKYWEQDSLNLALHGDNLNLGFLDIISSYRRTPAGNLARFYAGHIYLVQGEYLEAIHHLERFKARDPMAGPTALRMLGDAYLELNDHAKAVDYYLKAAKEANNEALTPEFLLRAGMTYEIMQDWERAHDTYTRIKKDYPNSHRANNIDKFIARVALYMEHGHQE